MHYLVLVAALLLAFAATAGADEPVASGRGVHNVVSFGATGNGKTDDTAAFQKALDEAGKTGGIVFVPAGRFAST